MAQQKELRIALVCYGGVSLAVYIHGVTREVLHLTRASRLLEDKRNQNEGNAAPRGSEAVWMEILEEVSATTHLMVIVDVITGASAGAINAVVLSRALAYDLSLDVHRDTWLAKADVCELMEPDHMAQPWSKWYLYLGLNRFIRRFWPVLARDPEGSKKLSMFFRSKWFKPPFSGPRLSNILLDGLQAMGVNPAPSHSLIPVGQLLECLITVTDYRGYEARLPMHSKAVKEIEHRHMWRFQFQRQLDGNTISDFREDNLPSLVFAARASASYAGAFQPARISEMDRLLKDRNEQWQSRDNFIKKNIRRKLRGKRNECDALFVDGGIVNNKPFDAALTAINERPAHREVDRRIIYIEPAPASSQPVQTSDMPGFFATLGRCMSSIPRHEPIRDHLKDIQNVADNLKFVRAAVMATEPNVRKLVEKIIGSGWRSPSRLGSLAKSREQAMSDAKQKAGLVYLPYLTLRFTHNMGELAERLVLWINFNVDKQQVTTQLEYWAKQKEYWATSSTEKLESLLHELGIDIRIRRIRFVLRSVNDLYAQDNSQEERDWLDHTKQMLYKMLGTLLFKLKPEYMPKALISAVERLGEETDTESVDQLLTLLKDHFSLGRIDRELDETIIDLVADATPEKKQALLSAYVGFPYHDVVAFPALRQKDLAELPSLQVNRISPDDVEDLVDPAEESKLLQGAILNKFGAFFSRKLRENDYLWGRLIAAERLFKIVTSSAGFDAEQRAVALKTKLYRAIIEEERPHLQFSHSLIAELEQRIDQFERSGMTAKAEKDQKPEFHAVG